MKLQQHCKTAAQSDNRHFTGAKAIVRAMAASLLLAVAAHAQSFNYPDFSASSLAACPLQLNGNAVAPQTGLEETQVLRLTSTNTGQKSSAFILNPVNLGSNASFSTAFSFQLAHGGGNGAAPKGADGIVFVLTTTGNTVGIDGAGAGFVGISNSLGIKFDTYKDGSRSFPQYSDPNGNFVAVYTNGVIETTNYVPYSITNPPGQPQYYTPPTSMKNGDVWHAWIDYNGATGELDLRLTDGTNARPAIPQLIQTFFVTDSTSLGTSPKVYAGFTSATGTQFQDQDILAWQFFDDFNPGGIPTLDIQKTTDGVILLWPAASGNFRLQENSTAGSTNWAPVPNLPTAVNGTNQVSISPAPGNMFYRLSGQ